MDDKKKQIVPWDFTQLQESLERYYGSPERLLLEAYKGILDLSSLADNDADLESVKNAVFPVKLIIDNVYQALVEKENAEFYLDHPNINRINK